MVPPDDFLECLGTTPPERRGPGFERVVLAYFENRLNRAVAQRATEALRDAGLLDPGTLAGVDLSELIELLRAAGQANAARLAGPLPRIAEWWSGHAADEASSTASLRDELIAIRGVGPATADAILLFGLDRTAFPVSRAAHRVFVRHGWIDATATYEEAAETATRLVGDAPERLRRLSDGLESIGTRSCRVSVARCESCPLRPWLPASGPIEPV